MTTFPYAIARAKCTTEEIQFLDKVFSQARMVRDRPNYRPKIDKSYIARVTPTNKSGCQVQPISGLLPASAAIQHSPVDRQTQLAKVTIYFTEVLPRSGTGFPDSNLAALTFILTTRHYIYDRTAVHI
jgi:hypothetical protein